MYLIGKESFSVKTQSLVNSFTQRIPENTLHYDGNQNKPFIDTKVKDIYCVLIKTIATRHYWKIGNIFIHGK